MDYQGHIYVALLDPVRGSEQAGRRPVLVVSREHINQLLRVVNVVPIRIKLTPSRHTRVRVDTNSV